ncbi:MAG: hypothetical protein ACR2QQ_13875 [Gammaproteobacteria bacterium]
MRCHRATTWRASISRSFLLASVAIAGGCASTGPDTGIEPLRAACNARSNCFNPNNIRAYQPLGNSTAILFIGPNRCPFQVTVDGFYCALRGSGSLAFLDLDGQICNLDRSPVVTGPFARRDDDCRVRDVEPLNDDELLEIFAEYEIVEPLPASGSGELVVVQEEPPQPAESADETETQAPGELSE